MRAKILTLGLILLALISCEKGIENPHSNNPFELLDPLGIKSFTVNPSEIFIGESATLSWTVSRDLKASIDCGIGEVPFTGAIVVSPVQTTVYTLTAYDEDRTLTKSAVLEVTTTSKTAIEIIGEPELFYKCSDAPTGQQYLEFQMTIKNVSDKFIYFFNMTLSVWAEPPQGEGDCILSYTWYGNSCSWLPRDILPGEERIIISGYPLSLGKHNDLCERMRDGRPEFIFSAHFFQ